MTDLSNVTPLRRPRINPAHPSLRPGTELFDQDDPDIAAADQCVLLTRMEAQLIASLLKIARPHLPSPRAVDEAISLLTDIGHRGVSDG